MPAWRRRSSAPTEPTTSDAKRHDERADHHQRRQRLAAQEGAVRPAVDDVERALEHAEERQRRPEQERAADDPERGRVRADRAHGVQDRVERRARERPLQLAHEERALVGLVDRAEHGRARGRAAARTRAARSRRSSRRGACRGRRRTSRQRSGVATGRRAVCSGAMDAAQALADLTEISSQVVDVAIVDDGRLGAWRRRSPIAGRAERFVERRRDAWSSRPTRCARRAACRTWPSSRRRRSRAASSSSAATAALIAATTRPDPTVGLVFYDLKHCLRSIEDGRGRRRTAGRTPRATRKKAGRCRVGSSPG